MDPATSKAMSFKLDSTSKALKLKLYSVGDLETYSITFYINRL